ncbi:transcription factor grauzone-like [Wyeomyia smithii]|uniref:transcription factor grauzone-like n=1 Tax=Wyeomyia smithii TaxID=174621 RepID=UPI002467CF85|nr:transcription factor grauzone-like [Wyeomyia smithii]
MVRKCCVCTLSERQVEPTVSFHRIPNDSRRMSEWNVEIAKNGCELHLIGPRTTICSNHFQNEDFIITAGGKHLRSTAVPRVSTSYAGCDNFCPPRMVTTELKNCFTCCRRTENFLCITDDDNNSGENVEEIFAKHFWFTREVYQNGIVCTSCWEKIDEFHKFYCEVEKLHATTKAEADVKVESNDGAPDDESLIFAETVIKCEEPNSLYVMVEKQEINPADDNDDAGTSHEAGASDASANVDRESAESESESNVPLAKRFAASGRKKQKQPVPARSPASTQRNEKFICHLCAQVAGSAGGRTYKTFYWLKQHFNKDHNKSQCYIFCCEKKWFNTRNYNRHVSAHHDKTRTMKNRCVECARWFKEESSFQAHMFLVHTPDEAKKFKCNLCTKCFVLEDQLNSHITWHEEVKQKNYYCSLCDRYFVVAGHLEKHMERHHGSDSQNIADDDDEDDSEPDKSAGHTDDFGNAPAKPRPSPEEIEQQESVIKQFVSFNCTRCEYMAKSFGDLKTHTGREHNTSGSIVICCERSFNARLKLYDHCLRHQNPDMFKCQKCDKNFTDSRGLQHHNWWVHTPISERPFKCDICGDCFMKDYMLKAHMEKHIEKQRKAHSCVQCGRVYPSVRQLKKHMQRDHGAFTNWVCDMCAMGFAHRKLLDQHRLTHSMEGLLKLRKQCDKCQKWLSNEKSFKRHKIRCNAPPARCEICGHVSTYEGALKSHMLRMHSDIKKYACSFCGKEFKKQIRCKEHEANHTGVVLYKCPFCPRSCNSSSNMYTHKKTAHPEQWAEAIAAKLFTPT